MTSKYETRVRELEAEGMTRSDAQGVADAEAMNNAAVPMFKELTPAERSEYRQWADDNYTPGDAINPVWHPVVQERCAELNCA